MGAGAGGQRQADLLFSLGRHTLRAGHWLSEESGALLLGPSPVPRLLTGPSPSQSLSRAGVGASLRASPPRPCVSAPPGSPAARCSVVTEAVCVCVPVCDCVRVSVCLVWVWGGIPGAQRPVI